MKHGDASPRPALAAGSIRPGAAGRRAGVLVGIAGSHRAYSLSLYNLKAYAYRDAAVRSAWDLQVVQHPLIGVDGLSARVAALAEQVIARRPALVGFSCYMWNLEAFRALSALLRSRLPAATIVWGGPEISTDYVIEGRYDALEADYLVSGEGELTFLELLRHLSTGAPARPEIAGLSFREKPIGPFVVNARRTPFKSLDEVPSPYLTGVVDDQVLQRERVQANLETQRGCNLRCSYCIYHKDMAQISFSSVQRVLEEVTFVTNKGVRDVRFVDANFGSDLGYAKAVMRGMIERRFEAKLMFELIPGFIDEELAALFGAYNALYDWNDITLGIGVQTINLDVLRRVRRGIRLERFEETFDLVQRFNVYAKIDLIIGLPGEDMASIERTLEYMLARLAGSRAHLLCCHVMRGLPGTELLDIARAHGMVFSSRYEPHELVESPALPRADMVRCLRRTAVVFRLINHAGWANQEFLSGRRSGASHIADAFFAARGRLGGTHVAVVDLLVAALMEHLAARDSHFVHPDFPFAESWWWGQSRVEIEDEWLMEVLAGIGPRAAGAEPAGAAPERRSCGGL